MSLERLANFQYGTSRPLLCIEVNPPRGTDLTAVFARLDGQLAGVDFLNVTDCALAKMRFSAPIFAGLLKQRLGIEPLVNLSCRDRNLIALQSDLLGAWALGVRSVVALTGDAVTVGDDPERKAVFEVNSIGLLNCIKTLNSGKDLVGHDLKGAPDFCPGVVVNPNVKNPAAELRRLEKKRVAGGRYALSQPVFDKDAARSFFTSAKSIGVPIFLGLLPLKSKESAVAISKVPGIRMSEAQLAEFHRVSDEGFLEYSLGQCQQLAESLRDLVCGFHVISGATPSLAMTLASRLAASIRG